ncbi:MAG: DinB family protein, partial [Gemmatimonadaceae bacterium]
MNVIRHVPRAVVLATAFSFAVPTLGAQTPAAAATPLQGELVRDINVLERKYVGLAEAVPADKLTWRPAEGVRSIAEVLNHVAGATYFLARVGSMHVPANAPPNEALGQMEKVTDRARIVEALKRSFADARTIVTSTPAADLDKPIKMFGQDHTVRSAMLMMVTHMHEHLGQAIAYARANNVKPPW